MNEWEDSNYRGPIPEPIENESVGTQARGKTRTGNVSDE